MVIRALSLVATLAFAATRIVAQDTTALRDDQLLGAVVSATEAQDADRLLALMTEARLRGLLMFGVDGQSCAPVMPQTGPFASLIWRGSAQWAYITRVHVVAIERGDCGCPFARLSFDDFALELTGAAAADLTQDELSAFQAYRAANERVVEQAWQDFRQNSCGD